MTSDNVAPGRASEAVDSERNMIALLGELARYKANSLRWKIDFDVQLVDEAGQKTITVTARTGDRGLRKTISAENIAYFNADFKSFIDDLGKEFLQEILWPSVDEALSEPLLKAMKNASQINSGKRAL